MLDDDDDPIGDVCTEKEREELTSVAEGVCDPSEVVIEASDEEKMLGELELRINVPVKPVTRVSETETLVDEVGVCVGDTSDNVEEGRDMLVDGLYI